jgi:hypothetical protein
MIFASHFLVKGYVLCERSGVQVSLYTAATGNNVLTIDKDPRVSITFCFILLLLASFYIIRKTEESAST